MKSFIYQITFTFLFVIVLTYAIPYEKKQQGISDETLEAALSDNRYLQRQIKCALSEGVCDPVGRKLKRYAPSLLRGSCPDCTPVEVRQVQKVLDHIKDNFPKEWSRMVKLYTSSDVVTQQQNKP